MSKVVLHTHIEEFPLITRGKVRDIYDLGDSLLFIASDRISAFDVVMPNGIPEKGNVLTAMSLFWFDFLGLISAGDWLRPMRRVAGFEEEVPAGPSDDPFLLDRERLAKQQEQLDLLVCHGTRNPGVPKPPESARTDATQPLSHPTNPSAMATQPPRSLAPHSRPPPTIAFSSRKVDSIPITGRVRRKRRRHENHRHVRSGCRNGVMTGVEHRQAMLGLGPALAGRHAGTTRVP